MVKIAGRAIKNLRHANDTTTIAEDPTHLKLLVNKEKHSRAEIGLELNLAKTEVMTTGKSQLFTIDGQDLEIVECYTSLGLIFTKDGMRTIKLKEESSWEKLQEQGRKGSPVCGGWTTSKVYWTLSK